MPSVDDKRNTIRQHLESLIEQVDDAVAALAVTTDGHLVARAEKREVPSKRLAAMGSTLMSLGDTITRELQMGRCKNVISENEQGVVIFMHLSLRTVLVAMAASPSSLGLLLSASRHCIESIKADFNTSQGE